MKTMKKQMMTLAAVLMAGAAVTSCSSDNEMDSLKAPAAKTYTMTVSATKGGDETRALSLSGEGDKTLNATWTAGDEVEVWTADGTTKKYGTLTAQSDGASTTLSGSLDELPSNGTLMLKYLSPSYSQQDGTLTGSANSIDKVCDYATATVTATVSDNKVTASAASFTNQQAVVKFTLTDNAATPNAIKPTALTINDGTNDIVTLTGITDDIYTTNGDGVLYVAIPGFSDKAITLTATVGEDTYTCTASSKSFTNGKYYRVTAKMAKQASAPDGALSGQFTVGMDGETPIKVYFSKGNLQAKIANYNSTTKVATASEWKFADSQDSYIGNAAGNTSFAADTWVDLFSWVGNSATNDTYGLITFTSNSQANHGNVSGESLKTDWGSRIGTGWRTLTKDEWKYVFGTNSDDERSGATVGVNKNARFTEAIINTEGTPVYGIILFPDGATFAADEATWGSINGSSNWETKCTTAQWTALEAKGCVFLPAAGYREGTSVSDVGSKGSYWSSTANGSDGAFLVNFYLQYVAFAERSDRFYGYSVRLVRNVPSN